MKRLSGFSLMEMMVVLLIVAIVAAASAPMISKKLTSGTGTSGLGGGCLWSTVGWGNNKIYFNGDGNTGKQVSIGEQKVEDGTSGSASPVATMLNINTNDNSRPQISLRKNSGNQLKGLFNGSSFWLSTSTPHTPNATHTVAIGPDAMTSGNYVTALGYDAQAHGSLDSDSYSTAIGAHTDALGIYSTAIGASAKAEKDYSIAIGLAMANNKNAIAIGTRSPASSSASTSSTLLSRDIEASGSRSIAIGAGPKASNMNSIAIGSTTKNLNTTAGLQNKQTVSSGDGSIAIGSGVESTSVRSIAIGNTYAIGSHSSVHSTIAKNTDSIAIGSGAYSAGTNGIAIGKDSRVQLPSHSSNAIAIGTNASATGNNSVAIGANATAIADEKITLGTSSSTVYIPGNLVVGGNTYLGASSKESLTYVRPAGRRNEDGMIQLRAEYLGKNDVDITFDLYNSAAKVYTGSNIVDCDRRLKNVGEEFKGGLEQIKKLEVFNFTYKKDPDKTPRVGVMAQDLQKVFPKAVIKGEDGFLRIRMEDMFYALVNAVKELASKFDSHDKQIQELIKQNQEQQKIIEKLEKRLEKLEKKI